MDARVRLSSADKKTEEDFYAAVEGAGFNGTRRFDHGLMNHIVPGASPEDIRRISMPMESNECENR